MYLILIFIEGKKTSGTEKVRNFIKSPVRVFSEEHLGKNLGTIFAHSTSPLQ